MAFAGIIDQIVVLGQVLLWLKQWDSGVFGSEIRSTSEEVLSALKRHSTIAQHHKPLNRGQKWSNGRYINSRGIDESDNSKSIQDVLNKKAKHVGPPEQKVITKLLIFVWVS